MDKQVKTAAEEYANKNGMKLEYLDGDEFDTGPGQMRAFLAGHSLANDRIKELENQVTGAKVLLEMEFDKVQEKDKRIAELSALLLQREGEAVEFAEWVENMGYCRIEKYYWTHEKFYLDYEKGDSHKRLTSKQLHALFIESKNKK